MSSSRLKIVVAPNALKGSLDAQGAAEAIGRGVRRVMPEIELCLAPVADGGDGMRRVLQAALGLETLSSRVQGPLGEPIDAPFLFDPGSGLALIELADAAGLALLPPDRRDPLKTSTFGAGQLIRAALDRGASRILLGIGGSATHDGGTGIASALGVRFLDDAGRELAGEGASLERISAIDFTGVDPRLSRTSLEVASDVDNPLLGEQGAARVYAPQKGAGARQVEQLERGLTNLAEVISRELGVNIHHLPGAGAAGGAGGGLHGLFGAMLRPGAELVLDLTGFRDKLAGADLVITAEGRLDGQTARGKAPAAVARQAKAAGIPCIAIGGSLGEGHEKLIAAGIDALFSLCPGPITLEQAMADAPRLLEDATEQAFRLFLLGSRT